MDQDWYNTIRGTFIKRESPKALRDAVAMAVLLPRGMQQGMSLEGIANLSREEQMERLGNIMLAGIGGMVKRAKYPIPQMRTTEEAIAFGKTLTPKYAEQVSAAMRASHRKSRAMRHLPKTSENFRKQMAEAMRGQFYREALETYREKLPWNTKTTDMSFYDSLLAKREAKLEWMSPEDYMREVTKGFGRDFEYMARIKDKDLAREYAAAMGAGSKFPVGLLEGRGLPKGQFQQEGFHRAWAAMLRGEREIPVATWTDPEIARKFNFYKGIP